MGGQLPVLGRVAPAATPSRAPAGWSVVVSHAPCSLIQYSQQVETLILIICAHRRAGSVAVSHAPVACSLPQYSQQGFGPEN